MDQEDQRSRGGDGVTKKKYRVIYLQDVVYSCSVQVEAESPEEAIKLAKTVDPDEIDHRCSTEDCFEATLEEDL